MLRSQMTNNFRPLFFKHFRKGGLSNIDLMKAGGRVDIVQLPPAMFPQIIDDRDVMLCFDQCIDYM
jgi:hypothetical protein